MPMPYLRLKNGSLAAVILLLFVGKNLYAQNIIWVSADGTAQTEAGDNGKAREQAIRIAEQNALKKALAIGITPETLLVNLRLSGSILTAIPYGKVIKNKILQEGLVASGAKDSGKPGKYHVRIKAGVVEQANVEDSSFFFDAALNQTVFQDGDELKITIRSTQKCYFAIFNILDDNKIIPLLPNDKVEKNYLAANEKYTFPTPEDRRKGYKIRVCLPEDREVATESIYILALLQPFRLKSDQSVISAGQEVLLQDLIPKVISIAPKNRAEALMSYEITKTETTN